MRKNLALIPLIGLLSMKKASKRVTFILEQQGEKLKGSCCEPEHKFTGVVQGDQVTFESDQDNGIQKTYTGTIETLTKMTGTVKYIEDGVQFQRKWSAIKQGR